MEEILKRKNRPVGAFRYIGQGNRLAIVWRRSHGKERASLSLDEVANLLPQSIQQVVKFPDLKIQPQKHWVNEDAILPDHSLPQVNGV